MSLIYGIVDRISRTNVPVHLRTLDDLGVLDRVLSIEGDGADEVAVDADIYSMPRAFTRFRHHAMDLSNVVGDYYLRRYLTPDADTLLGWSGLSALTIARANELGLRTFVIRGSPHVLESQRVLGAEYRKFGVERSVGTLDSWRETYEYQAADGIITVSEYAAETFAEHGIDREKVSVVPFDCGVEQYLGTEDRSSEDVFTVCTATTVSLLRGVQYLLEAWEQFADGKDDVRLRIAGGIDDDFPTDLVDRAASRDDVVFHGWVNDVQSLYAESDAFALTSLADGGPCGPFEAMAAGVPVVVSEHMGVEMDVREGDAGFVVPIRDPEAIADRLEELYADPEKRRELGANGRVHAETTVGRQADALQTLYRTEMARD